MFDRASVSRPIHSNEIFFSFYSQIVETNKVVVPGEVGVVLVGRNA